MNSLGICSALFLKKPSLTLFVLISKSLISFSILKFRIKTGTNLIGLLTFLIFKVSISVTSTSCFFWKFLLMYRLNLKISSGSVAFCNSIMINSSVPSGRRTVAVKSRWNRRRSSFVLGSCSNAVASDFSFFSEWVIGSSCKLMMFSLIRVETTIIALSGSSIKYLKTTS